MVDISVEFKTKNKDKVTKDLKDVKKTANETQSAFSKMGTSINQTFSKIGSRRQFSKLSKDASSLGFDIKKLNSEFKRYSNIMNNSVSSTVKMTSAQKRLDGVMGRMQSKISSTNAVMVKGKKDVEGFTNRIDALSRSVRLMEGPLGGTAARLQTFTAVLKSGKLGLVAMALALATTIGTFIVLTKKAFDLTRVMIPIDARFLAIKGSSKKARNELTLLFDQSQKLGVSFIESAKGFSLFSAAAANTTLTASQTRDIFEGVSVAASALSLSGDDLNGIMRAFTQILSKGTVQSEELKGQIGERLPGAFSIAAKAMKVTTSELQKMLEQGQVISSDFLPKFASALEDTFGNASLINNMNKELERLNNTWNSFLDSVSEGLRIEEFTSFFAKGLNSLLLIIQDSLIDLANASRSASEKILKPLERIREAKIALANEMLNEVIPIKPGLPMVGGGLKVVQDNEARNLQEVFSNELAGRTPTVLTRELPSQSIIPQPDFLDFPIFREGEIKLAKDFIKELSDFKGLSQRTLELPPKLTKEQEIKRGKDLKILNKSQTASFQNDLLSGTITDGTDEDLSKLKLRLKLMNRLSKAQVDIQSVFGKAIKDELFSEERLRKAEMMRNMIADTLTPLEEYRKKLEALNRVETFSAVQKEAVIRKQKQLREEFIQSEPVLKSLSNAFDSLGATIGSVMRDSGNAMETFRGIASSVINDIMDKFIQMAIINPIADVIFGGISKFLTTTGTTGTTGTIEHAEEFMAHGGPVSAGTAYVVGERGAERFIPSTDGTIISNDNLRSGSKGGGDVYNIDARGADKEGIRRLENLVRSLNGSIEHRAYSTVVSNDKRRLHRG